MRIALLADIHANREAFDAVLMRLRDCRIDRIALLGDIVGYGADPVYCTEKAAQLVESGAIAVIGNHDAAIDGSAEDMNSMARAAISWTRDQLGAPHRAFLRQLPDTQRDGDLLLVHASARAPRGWEYITDALVAERSIRATDARISIVGHVHAPHLWRLNWAGVATGHVPTAGVEIPLAASQSWLAVMGAVGQPRDGKPAAAFGILDRKARTLTFERVPYDHYAASRRVREVGLPTPLAERLLKAR